ncbi:hypothetical protein ACOSQ3_011639 [Xanthoceras sorbifolium]
MSPPPPAKTASASLPETLLFVVPRYELYRFYNESIVAATGPPPSLVTESPPLPLCQKIRQETDSARILALNLGAKYVGLALSHSNMIE